MDHIGIDVHKKDSQICILTEQGELLERRVRTEPGRFAEVRGPRPPARILIESATESEWVALCFFMEASGRSGKSRPIAPHDGVRVTVSVTSNLATQVGLECPRVRSRSSASEGTVRNTVKEVGDLSFGHRVGGPCLREVPLARERLQTLGGGEGLGRRQVPDGAHERVGGDGNAGGVRAVECLAHGREQARRVPGKELGEPVFEGRIGRRDLSNARGSC